MDGRVFREDFYYRLCSDIIEVPPLRTRIQQDTAELDALLNFTVTRMLGLASPKITAKIKRIIDRRLGNHYSWPGNVRELEQCVRSVLLRRDYPGKLESEDPSLSDYLCRGIQARNLPVSDLLSGYCTLLYDTWGTYEKVAQKTGLDRRTVKKHIRNLKQP
jgi:transcriptional regulator with GAF, ATPase, and Fis domain